MGLGTVWKEVKWNGCGVHRSADTNGLDEMGVGWWQILKTIGHWGKIVEWMGLSDVVFGWYVFICFVLFRMMSFPGGTWYESICPVNPGGWWMSLSEMMNGSLWIPLTADDQSIFPGCLESHGIEWRCNLTMAQHRSEDGSAVLWG